MLIFIPALLVLLASSLPWVAVSRLSNRSAWLMALYLICSANVVLSSCIASSFHVMNQRWVLLVLHMLIGGIGWLMWKYAGQPALWFSSQGVKEIFETDWLRREPILALLSLSIFVSYIFALAQIILIPQNNVDSLSTHLSRIGFWRQYGSLLPWPTYMLNQLWYPINAQLQTYWTLLFLGNDRLVGGVQWLAALICGLGVFGMARLFGYHRRQSAFAALIFLSFPLVALQATTTQTDLVTAAFFIPAVYFLVLGIKENQYSILSLSAISVGLGVGVKKSYFLLLPVLAVIALLVVFQYGRRTWKPLLYWSINMLVGIALLGSYIYIVNWKYFGNPFGSPTLINYLIEMPQSRNESPTVMPHLARLTRVNAEVIPKSKDSLPGSDIFLEVIYNAPRLLYQAVDTSGLPRPLDGYSHKVKMRLARAFFQWIGFDEIEGTAYTAPGHAFSFSEKNINEESHAWYGPLSVLLLFPTLLLQSWRGARRRSYLMLIPGVALLIFLPLEIIFRPGWDPYQGRYFAPLVALCSPFMATWFKEKGDSIHEWLFSGLAIMILAVTLLYNPSKPTLGKFADEFHVWSNSRAFVQTIQRKNNRHVYYMVEEFVPAETTLGYYIPYFFLDYPLFGENVSRRLVSIYSPAQIADPQWLRAQGIEYLLLTRGSPMPPSEYQLISQSQGWNLYALAP